MSSSIPLTEEDLHDLYVWVDEIPLSKPKRNIARDFSDGTCVAEILKHYFPRLVELHNFTPANSTQQKINNWNTINARVLRKLHFEVPTPEIMDIVSAVPGAIERFLRALRTKITQIKSIQEQKMLARGDADGDADDILLGGGAGLRYQSTASAAARPISASARAPPLPRAAAEQPLPPFQNSVPSSSRPATNNNAVASKRAAAAAADTPNHYDNVPSTTQGLRQLLDEKDRTILELRESITLLTDKVSRMEELMRIKDEKIMRYKQQLNR